MTEPTTEAGRALLTLHANCQPMTACTMHGDLAHAVIAIEAEAAERAIATAAQAGTATDLGYEAGLEQGRHEHKGARR